MLTKLQQWHLLEYKNIYKYKKNETTKINEFALRNLLPYINNMSSQNDSKPNDLNTKRVALEKRAGKYLTEAKYAKVAPDAVTGNLKTSSSNKISGAATTFWKTSGSNPKYDPEHIYVPSIRLSGKEGNIIKYLRDMGYTDENIRLFLESKLTIGNQNSTQPVNWYYLASPGNLAVVQSSPSGIIERETAMVKQKNEKEGSQKLDLTTTLNEINGILDAYGSKVFNLEKSEPVKKTGSGNLLSDKLNELSPAHAINVSSYNPATTKGTKLMVKGIPKKGAIPFGSSGKLSSLYFKLDDSGSIPAGAISAYMLVTGSDQATASAELNRLTQARSSALPTVGKNVSYPSVQQFPSTSQLNLPQLQSSVRTPSFNVPQAGLNLPQTEMKVQPLMAPPLQGTAPLGRSPTIPGFPSLPESGQMTTVTRTPSLSGGLSPRLKFLQPVGAPSLAGQAALSPRMSVPQQILRGPNSPFKLPTGDSLGSSPGASMASSPGASKASSPLPQRFSN